MVKNPKMLNNRGKRAYWQSQKALLSYEWLVESVLGKFSIVRVFL
jgi:hypothetical protein